MGMDAGDVCVYNTILSSRIHDSTLRSVCQPQIYAIYNPRFPPPPAGDGRGRTHRSGCFSTRSGLPFRRRRQPPQGLSSGGEWERGRASSAASAAASRRTRTQSRSGEENSATNEGPQKRAGALPTGRRPPRGGEAPQGGGDGGGGQGAPYAPNQRARPRKEVAHRPRTKARGRAATKGGERTGASAARDYDGAHA